MSKQLPLDFHASVFCGEARKALGEDNWCYGFCEDTGLIAVFDGCGGTGARKHEAFRGHTEAYMASRLCAGAVYECLQRHFPCAMAPEEFVRQVLTPAIEERIRGNIPPERVGGVRIKGMRTLPSTMAGALLQSGSNAAIQVSPIWSGDSRVYILDPMGLHQLTVDDSNQPDPMEGLYDDGVLTNVLCAGSPAVIHCRTYQLRPPFLVIAATDGCFGYVSTPMEFEGMVLHTLLESDCVAKWEENLQKLVASFAGDDHTLCLASFGFGSFENLQFGFRGRYKALRQQYLETIWETPWEDRDTRRSLWAQYRTQYMKYIEGEKR